MSVRASPTAIVAGAGAIGAIALLWSAPFLWMVVASLRPDSAGSLDIASLMPSWPPSWANFRLAWESADFLLNYWNTLMVVAGTLTVQLVTMSLAGYAFARLRFRGRDLIFYLFLLQLMIVPPVLIVPNLKTVTRLGIYDTLWGVMAPYWASAFGTFLMRQTFLGIPRDFEDAAEIDGCTLLQTLRYVLLPLAKPALIAFGIVSVVAHWNEFLWPLMVIDSPSHRTLTLGLASFVSSGEGDAEWGLIAAGTLIVSLPLFAGFIAFQRQFINSFVMSGIK
ncbi:MAG TPA: carbohydrate ABC transporter permease [Stellaceae bacterium]|nr:carbohydrate ABC transporter permease [Stellaceae bacterium]